jgi:hypothetical protein
LIDEAFGMANRPDLQIGAELLRRKVNLMQHTPDAAAEAAVCSSK